MGGGSLINCKKILYYLPSEIDIRELTCLCRGIFQQTFSCILKHYFIIDTICSKCKLTKALKFTGKMTVQNLFDIKLLELLLLIKKRKMMDCESLANLSDKTV